MPVSSSADPLESRRHRFAAWPPLWAVAAACIVGALAGTLSISTTSIGWHLASGRWIIAHHAVPHADPFSFTALGTPWLDHEWLFQVAVAAVDEVAGGTGLVVLRSVLIAALGVVLLVIGHRAGLGPGLALLVASVALAGARMRFFLRPELVTLIVVPVAVVLFLDRRRLGLWPAIGSVGALVALGANCHAGVFAAPALIAVAFAGEIAATVLGGHRDIASLRSGTAVTCAALLAPLATPYGWRLYTVPVRLSRLIGLPHIPNPEWIAPGPTDAPALYVAIIAAVLLLTAAERRPGRWLLLVAVSALALRHVRHVGLFFVTLPVIVSPALARIAEHSGKRGARRAGRLAWVATAVLAVWFAVVPTMRFANGPWAPVYPRAACNVLDREGLRELRLYNDVNFGGYLIGRYFPGHRVFLDDRNEVHEPLLAEIYRMLSSSDVAGWQAMLDRWGIGAALVRYHPPVSVRTPAGRPLGLRGFSALWFPSRSWALVYWDDVAMVLVDRTAVPADWLDAHEYRLVRPDDGDELARELARGEVRRGEVAREVRRALREAPGCRRALDIGALLVER